MTTTTTATTDRARHADERARRRQSQIEHHMVALSCAIMALRNVGADDVLRRRFAGEIEDMMAERALRTGRTCPQPTLLGAPGTDFTRASAPATRRPPEPSPRDVLTFRPRANANRINSAGAQSAPGAQES